MLSAIFFFPSFAGQFYSFPNSTGAYELDLSLVNPTTFWGEAWREMHVKTDVFCSGSIILPDKGGRQINVGGWAEGNAVYLLSMLNVLTESTFGIRLYTPNGVAGVNSTNDWEENSDLLHLQVSILFSFKIVHFGSARDGILPQQCYQMAVFSSLEERLARTTSRSLILKFYLLRRVATLLSSSIGWPVPIHGIFIHLLLFFHRVGTFSLVRVFVTLNILLRPCLAYYNEARIIDAETFQTDKVLPNIPAAVNNCRFPMLCFEMLRSCSSGRAYLSSRRVTCGLASEGTVHGPTTCPSLRWFDTRSSRCFG